MPTIKLSTGARNEIAASNGLGSGSNFTYIPGFAHSSAKFRVMKGALPSQAELDDLAPTWSRIKGGSPTDILLEMDIYFLEVGGREGNFYLNQRIETATQSGVASWWIWTGNVDYNPLHRGFRGSPSIDEYLACMVGTISQRGGSPVGDLTLDDVNIVAGNSYQIGPVEIEVPEVITW